MLKLITRRVMESVAAAAPLEVGSVTTRAATDRKEESPGSHEDWSLARADGKT
jgi:hypothetical protein